MFEGDVARDGVPKVGGRSPTALCTVVETFALTLKWEPLEGFEQSKDRV